MIVLPVLVSFVSVFLISLLPTTYDYNYKNKKLFSSRNKNLFALFETVMYNENISEILPFNRNVKVHYELKETEVVNNFEEKKQWLIDESKSIAYANLPIGNIEKESTETHIVNETMFAITTITINGTLT